MTGGFATGELLAGGPLQEYERKLLSRIPAAEEPGERGALNAYHLTEAGFRELLNLLRTRRYDVTVPEEGALPVAAWLVKNGYTAEAGELLAELSPFFPRLRFYPVPLEKPRPSGFRVHLREAGQAMESLRNIKANRKVLAQKEAAEVWAPLHDRIVALFLETVENQRPCATYRSGWADRALALLDDYGTLRRTNTLCRKPEKANGHQRQLRVFLERCALEPGSLSEREVGRVRRILAGYIGKRSTPGSHECAEARLRQKEYVSGPMFHSIAKLVATRLERHPRNSGLDEVSHLLADVSPGEEAGTGIPAGTPVPRSIRRKVELCLNQKVETLIERGLITSGETLARALPQVTSGLRAAGIDDPELRPLYAAIYRAFRQRRSLLLLNLQRQVQIEELPWVRAIERFRRENRSTRDQARQTLEEVVSLTLVSFPHQILPNKLLQELRGLVTGADLRIPLVAELAADIFTGTFSDTFPESARQAGGFLEGSLYAAYYRINCRELRETPDGDSFARLCAARAGVTRRTSSPATNGMIIEQQQILTTHNLAALFLGLNLADSLRNRLSVMAMGCFAWICRRAQVKTHPWRARLIMVKNTACAWRQMVFYLSLLPDLEVSAFIDWAETHLNRQSPEFRNTFHPALTGLSAASTGVDSDNGPDARCFLGWSDTLHWMLAGSRSR
jgi:hypothetical protein